MFAIWKRLSPSHFLSKECTTRKTIHKKVKSNVNGWLFAAVLIPSGVACFCASVYLWTSRDRVLEEKRKLLWIKDTEFTGAKLVKVHSPYLSESGLPKWCLPEDLLTGASEAQTYLTGRLHPNDVFVASYPKSGTTWISEIVFLLVTKLNWKEALSHSLEERVPYVEYIWPGAKKIAEASTPRIIKTHLPFSFLPKDVQCGRAARIVYIVRDPRDVVVSFYHFVRCFVPAGYKNAEGVDGFVRRFTEDRLPYSPWSEHVKSYLYPAASWASSKVEPHVEQFQPKVLVVRYESLKADPTTVIKQIESFLLETWTNGEGANQKPNRLTDAQLEALVKHCSFSQMSKNPMTNYTWFQSLGLWSCKEDSTQFLRRGVVGDHKTLLSTEQAKSLASKAKDSGLEWTLRDA